MDDDNYKYINMSCWELIQNDNDDINDDTNDNTNDDTNDDTNNDVNVNTCNKYNSVNIDSYNERPEILNTSFANYMYKAIACKYLYKRKHPTTLYELRHKNNKPYKNSPLRDFVSIKYKIDNVGNIDTLNSNNIIVNDFKKLKKEVIVDGWVML